MKPFVKLIHGDCLDYLPVMRTVQLGDRTFVDKMFLGDIAIDAIITDPPYGISQHRFVSRDMGGAGGRTKPFGSLDDPGRVRTKIITAMKPTKLHGDDRPFDPSPWVNYPKVVLFGANHYADKLPPSPGWFVWDKREGAVSDAFADAELAWTNQGQAVRVFSHKWRGMLRASEQNIPRTHPTQKPVLLMRWVMDMVGVTEGMTVLDPYMGSGTTGVACVQNGVNFIGIDIDEKFYAIAHERLAEAQEIREGMGLDV